MSGAQRDYWEFFAEDAQRTGSELCARLAAGIGRDEELKALAAHARVGQPHANLILAAVHFLLLRGADHPLTRFYATVRRRKEVWEEGENPFPVFRDFVAKHIAEIEPLIATRVTNTNEVGRSAILHAGFRAAAGKAQGPLSLIEIGPSAGLNMIWDKYGVCYSKDDKVLYAPHYGRRMVEGEDRTIAPLVIECQLRGEKVPPLEPVPQIGGRIGLELNPVDLANREDRDWLRALIWPDQIMRLKRLDRAIELFANEKPEIRAGDALALLPDALAAVPRDQVPVVYHTIAVYQFSKEMREALESILIIAGLRRPVWRLSFEYDGALYVLSLIRYSDGERTETRLASCHPHGTWLEWLA